MTSGAKQHTPSADIKACDPVWMRVQAEAEEVAKKEPALAGFVTKFVLSQDNLESAVVRRIASRLDHADVPREEISAALHDVIGKNPEIAGAIRVDLGAGFDRDPACERLIEPLLYFKGFHALQTARLAAELWRDGRRDFAYYLQSASSSVFGVDIHPAARIGKGIMLDHATAIVVGETAVIGDDVSILHGVTLGGTGKQDEDRHPKVGNGVLIGAGAKILGNIKIGDCVRIASGSVVLKDVPDNKTVAGVPARIVGEAGCPEPARAMDQMIESDL